MWLNARQEIGHMFAELQPTQWTALSRGWMFRPVQFWNNNGEVDGRSVRSRSYAWQASALFARLNRQHQAELRARWRYRVEQRRTHCRACGAPLDHQGHRAVRAYCGRACWALMEQKRVATIERRTEERACVICEATFVVDQHQAKKTCSDICRRRRGQQLGRERYQGRSTIAVV